MAVKPATALENHSVKAVSLVYISLKEILKIIYKTKIVVLTYHVTIKGIRHTKYNNGLDNLMLFFQAFTYQGLSALSPVLWEAGVSPAQIDVRPLAF